MWDQDRQQRWQQRMERRALRRQGRSGVRHAAPGLILVILGIAFLLTNLGILSDNFVGTYWPAALVIFGLVIAFTGGHFGKKLWGGFLTLFGLGLLANNLGYIHTPFWHLFWPLILIFLGISALTHNLCGRSYRGPGGVGAPPVSTGGPNVLNEVNVFGGVQRRIDSQEFEGGQVVSVFGGADIDLRAAATKKDEIHIELNSVFGGVDLRVPDTWDVTVQGSGIFGGYEDKTMPRRTPESGKRPHLIITGSAVFGGVTVS